MLGDLKSPRLMYAKAGLFVLLGMLGCLGVLLEVPSLRVAVCLAVAIWAFARAYYFAFYVIEHYVDPRFRYAGLWSIVRHFNTPEVGRTTEQRKRGPDESSSTV
jgi:hypothetical protein